jgi:hypothetical protein
LRTFVVSARYDLAWFYGGVAIAFLMLGLNVALGVPIVALFWLWLLGFDGPHMAAAFTRTYLDREEWRTRPLVLLGSLLAFAVGPLALLLDRATGGDQAFLAFLAVGALYGFYHVVRQHYGFLALYKSVNADHESFTIDKVFLYFGCWVPYVYFMLTHPRARVLMRLPAALAPWERVASLALAGAWGLVLLVWLARALTRERCWAKIAYLGVTVPLYGLIYFGLATLEPRYALSNGPDQDFLLISFMNTLPHNVQYVGLVWFHNENRYRGPGDFGPARVVSRSLGRYLAACLGFSAIYFLLAAWTGVFPGARLFAKDAWLGPFTATQVGLSLWWGLAIHHYVLDQKIWRIRGDPVLKRNLGLA